MQTEQFGAIQPRSLSRRKSLLEPDTLSRRSELRFSYRLSCGDKQLTGVTDTFRGEVELRGSERGGDEGPASTACRSTDGQTRVVPPSIRLKVSDLIRMFGRDRNVRFRA